MKLLMISFILMMSAFTLSADEVKKTPCKNIEKACLDAGFLKNGHKDKKGLHVDCMKPILQGKTISGVNVSSEDIKQCLELKKNKKLKKEETKKEETKVENSKPVVNK